MMKAQFLTKITDACVCVWVDAINRYPPMLEIALRKQWTSRFCHSTAFSWTNMLERKFAKMNQQALDLFVCVVH